MLSLVYSSDWFHGFDTFLELFSGVVALLIMLAGYRAYKLTKDKKYFYFSAAFAFITFSFFARAFTTLYLVFEAREALSLGMFGEPLIGAFNIFVLGRFAYVLTVLFAYLILLLLSMRSPNRHTDTRLIVLLSIFVVLFSVLSYTNALAFHLVALTFLIFISANFLNNYREKKSSATKLIFLSFALMTAECMFWIIANYHSFSLIMVLPYFARAASYLLFLIALARVYRK